MLLDDAYLVAVIILHTGNTSSVVVEKNLLIYEKALFKVIYIN